jgi:H+-transporting ATPase
MDDIGIGSETAKSASVKDILAQLDVDQEGLSGEESQQRREQYGPNEIKEKHISPLLKFLSYFWGPIPGMIEVAAVLSAVVQHWEDFWIIVALLLLNGAIGFWQEHKADNAIELLKKRLAPVARVRRDGKWQQIPARELVPGDVVRLRLGDIVPADVKLVDGDALQIDESALTGESMPVEKQTADVAYSGSIVRQGEADAVVVATGMETFFGKTAQLVEEAGGRSHFQKTVVKIGDYLIVLALALVALIFLVAVFRHEALLTTLQFALILTVAAIPAALPAVLSVTLAVGAARLAHKEAIVSRLAAIEEMAGMDVLCSDKTGTITENRLAVGEIIPFDGAGETDILLSAALASREEDQDPIDTAIVSAARNRRETAQTLDSSRVKRFIPFDPVSKRSRAEVDMAGKGAVEVAKGAPQAIGELTDAGEDLLRRLNEEVDRLAEEGFRALGVALRGADSQRPWRYLGLVALHDPARADSAETLDTARKMGVDVKMVTGDHVAIARQVAREVHMGTRILSAEAIAQENRVKRIEAMDSADGFAQVFPEHKYRIVEDLQQEDHIVGMTGDGVNDAPALKKADVGIAVAGATDAARSAADIVLTLPGLSVIIDAIKESRKIFQRMNSYAIYRITETIRVLFFITASIVAFNFYPVTAVMIVLLALLNDAPIMAIATDRVPIADRPVRWNMRVVLSMATFLGLIGVGFSFGVLYVGRDVLHLSRDMIQSLIFLKLAVAGHLTIFLTRTRGPFWTSRPSGALFWSAVATKALATLVVVYGWYVAPIGWPLALLVWGYAAVAFVITDGLKIVVYRLLDHSGLKFSR